MLSFKTVSLNIIVLRANGTQHVCMSETCPQRRKLSFSQEPDNEPAANISMILL